MSLKDLMDLEDPFDVCDCHETEGLGFAGKLCDGCKAKRCCIYCPSAEGVCRQCDEPMDKHHPDCIVGYEPSGKGGPNQ